MEILPLVIAVSLVLVVLIAGLFVWAVRSDQFEDLEGPAWRVLQDDDTRPPPAETRGEGDSTAGHPGGKDGAD